MVEQECPEDKNTSLEVTISDEPRDRRQLRFVEREQILCEISYGNTEIAGDDWYVHYILLLKVTPDCIVRESVVLRLGLGLLRYRA